MARSAESFVNIPKYYGKRSRYRLKPSTDTTMNVGDLVPLYTPIEIIPGSTFKVRPSSYLEMTPMIKPVFDVLFMDVFWFFCPLRILWENYIYFYGENKQDPFDSIGRYSIPQVSVPEGGYEVGTIADYMGVPTGVGEGKEISALLFRGYAQIVNEFFIADYIDSKANVNYSIDETIVGSNGSNYIEDLVKGGKPFIANKLHDKYTSALTRPQAGEPVLLPLGDVELESNLPVIPVAGAKNLTGTMPTDAIHYAWAQTSFQSPWSDQSVTTAQDIFVGANTNNSLVIGARSDSATYGSVAAPDNLMAIGSQAGQLSTTATINDLRYAIAVQHMLEAEMRHGNRYFEQLVGDYGVVNPDGRLQRPEYLGGSRFMLNVNQVVQSSSSTEDSAQGNLSGISITSFSHTDFTKTFTEPGLLFCLGCIRYPHSYQQGLPKIFSKKDKYDFFNRHFEGIGEQPVLNKEIYFGSDKDDEVFGYMPYGYEYKSLDRIITGEMRSQYNQSRDYYHYADYYEEMPTLSPNWLKEDKSNVDRTLTVQSSATMQFSVSISFDIDAYLPMYQYDIPGLRRL